MIYQIVVSLKKGISIDDLRRIAVVLVHDAGPVSRSEQSQLLRKWFVERRRINSGSVGVLRLLIAAFRGGFDELNRSSTPRAGNAKLAT
jgi:hypothetical protein